MGVDDNPSNIAAKQKQKIQSAKQKAQEGEKSSSSAVGSSEQIGGRTPVSYTHLTMPTKA